MLLLLLKGLMIGFCIAAPVGPIGILCINRALRDGFAAGFVAGCGAATADGCYGLVAGFGLTLISSFLMQQQVWIHWLGGLFLFYLGVKTFLSKPAENAAIIHENKNKLGKTYLSTFFLTITNPMTVLSFMAIFAGLGLGSKHISYLASFLLVSGVVMGSLSWWLILTFSMAKLLRHRINAIWLQRINQLSGVILILFAGAALVSLR